MRRVTAAGVTQICSKLDDSIDCGLELVRQNTDEADFAGPRRMELVESAERALEPGLRPDIDDLLANSGQAISPAKNRWVS